MALRTPLSVTPHLYMGDSTGRPLDMGTVYFGEQDKDPEFYPIELFSDDALTLPLAQPVHTKGGYLYDKGDMVEPHAKEIIYSVKVLDSYGRKVFYKGAMMRNSWNDDVIEQINAALVSTAEQSAQIATDVAKEIADKAVISSGFVTIDSFEMGATITQRNQALRHAADGKLYRWAGDLPKVVPASSTPTNSGGLGTNAWLEVSDTALRQEIVTGDLVTDAIVSTADGYNQKKVNDVLTKRTYYAELEGFVVGGADNLAAWNALHNKMNDGDQVIFNRGSYHFSDEITIDKVITLTGKLRSQALGTVFLFSGTSGVVRNSGYSTIEQISITGTKTSTVLDFDNRIFGTVGLKESQSGVSARSGGGILRDVSVIGFDVNRLSTQENAEVWAGAYRENYNLLLRSGRYGYVALDGATHEKFYGGVISANTEGGVWSSATIDTPEIPSTYNNIEFHGTSFEVNGKRGGLFDGGAADMHLNIYSGGNSRVSFFGAYNELVNNYAENGGQILYFGTYQHRNSVNYAKNGYISSTGSFAAHENKFVYNGRLSSLLTRLIGVTTDEVSLGSNSVNVKSTVSGSNQINTPAIPFWGIKNKHIRAVKLGVKYKFSSGYTANPELMINPIVRLTSSTPSRSDTSAKNRSYPESILKGEYGETNYFEFVFYPRFSGTGNLDKEGLLAGVQVQLHIKNGDADPDFTTDNLSLDIDILNISLFSDYEFPFTYTTPISGTTAERPKLSIYNEGYNYFDTTLKRSVVWNGSEWVETPISPMENSSTVALSSLSNVINTTNKYTRFVYNTTDGKIYYPLNAAQSAKWRPTDGSADLIPI